MGRGKLYLISIILLIIFSTSTFALYTEWWEVGQMPVVNTELVAGSSGMKTYYEKNSSIQFRVFVPANTYTELNIPRAYLEGKNGPGESLKNDFNHLFTLMNINKDFKTNCDAQYTTNGIFNGDDPSNVPYLCVKGNSYKLRKSWVDILSEKIDDIVLDDERKKGLSTKKVSSSVFDNGGKFVQNFPLPSNIGITEFSTKVGSHPYDGGVYGGFSSIDISSIEGELQEYLLQLDVDFSLTLEENLKDCEEECSYFSDNYSRADCNINCTKDNENKIIVYEQEITTPDEFFNAVLRDDSLLTNAYAKGTLTSMGIKGDAQSNPQHISLYFNNKRLRIDYSYYFPKYTSFSPDGTDPWTVDTKYSYLWRNIPEDEYANLRKWAMDYYEDDRSRWSKFLDDVFGKDPPKITVAGIYGVTVEVELEMQSIAPNALLKEEYVKNYYTSEGFNENDWNPFVDGYICMLHAPHELVKFKDPGFIEENKGYDYYCDDTQSFVRKDFRIVTADTGLNNAFASCTAQTNTRNSQHYLERNPIQIYDDIKRTEAFYIESFTNPYNNEVYGGSGIFLDYKMLMKDFNPDKSQNICMASNCKSDWYTETDKINDDSILNFTYKGEENKAYHFLFYRLGDGVVGKGRAVAYFGGLPTSAKTIGLYDEDGNLIESAAIEDKGYDVNSKLTKRAVFKQDNNIYQNLAYVAVIENPSIECAVDDVGYTGQYGGYENNFGENEEGAKCFSFKKPIDINGNNYCCGDDPSDVGYIQRNGNNVSVCIQNPEGDYEWIDPSLKNLGEIADIFDENFYKIHIKREEIEDFASGNMVSNFKRLYPWQVPNVDTSIQNSLLFTENKVFVCDDGNYDFNLNENDEAELKAEGVLNILGEGDTVSITRNQLTYEYVCYEEEGSYRIAECRDNNLFSLNKFSTFETQFPYWNSYSATNSNGLIKIASFENILEYYEFWNTFTNSSYSVEVSPGSVIEGENSLAIIYEKQEGDRTYYNTSSVHLPVKDWSEYDYLEGEILFDITPAMDIYFGNYRVELDQYLVKEPVANEFNYFKIPLNNIDKVGRITFGFDSNIFSFKDEDQYQFYIDNLNLVQENPSYGQYCGNVGTTGMWVEDRDDSPNSCTDDMGLSHTGTKCCGDDYIGDEGEYYVDENGGCWNSEKIENGTRFQVVEVQINSETYQMLCKDTGKYGGEECTKIIPRN